MWVNIPYLWCYGIGQFSHFGRMHVILTLGTRPKAKPSRSHGSPTDRHHSKKSAGIRKPCDSHPRILNWRTESYEDLNFKKSNKKKELDFGDLEKSGKNNISTYWLLEAFFDTISHTIFGVSKQFLNFIIPFKNCTAKKLFMNLKSELWNTSCTLKRLSSKKQAKVSSFSIAPYPPEV